MRRRAAEGAGAGASGGVRGTEVPGPLPLHFEAVVRRGRRGAVVECCRLQGITRQSLCSRRSRRLGAARGSRLATHQHCCFCDSRCTTSRPGAATVVSSERSRSTARRGTQCRPSAPTPGTKPKQPMRTEVSHALSQAANPTTTITITSGRPAKPLMGGRGDAMLSLG